MTPSAPRCVCRETLRKLRRATGAPGSARLIEIEIVRAHHGAARRADAHAPADGLVLVPMPPCYRATLTSFEQTPVLSYLDGSSQFQQVFNPAWLEPSSGTQGKAGLFVRSQNCTTSGKCVRCAADGQQQYVNLSSRCSRLVNDWVSDLITGLEMAE